MRIQKKNEEILIKEHLREDQRLNEIGHDISLYKK